MTHAAARKRELLKPPVIKPVLTLLVIFVCIFTTGDPNKGSEYINWCFDHSITAQKFFSTLEKNNIVGILQMCFLATFAQLGPFSFLINSGFWFLFGSHVEKKLLTWRYPAFLFLGMIGVWALFCYANGSAEPSQRFIGPYLFMFYLLGAYLVFKPKKPFKPAIWKVVRTKFFKGNETSGILKALNMPFVNPWTYICLYLAYLVILQFFFNFSGSELTDIVHIGLVVNIQRAFVGAIQPGSFLLLRPLPAVFSCLLGVLMAYLLKSWVVKSKLLRDAGELQLQAFLQYKELRALDMTHKQALEGTSKLISVPIEVVKDWVAKGLPPPPKDDAPTDS